MFKQQATTEGFGMKCLACGHRAVLTSAVGPLFIYHCPVCQAKNERLQGFDGSYSERASNIEVGWSRKWRLA